MGWFNKKEKVPEIPPASRIPDAPFSSESIERQDLPELPSFNNVNAGEQFNNAVIKSAVQDSSGEDEVSVEELPQDFNFPVPVQEDSSPVKKTLELAPKQEIFEKPMVKQNEPIFVRIDKFHDAKKDFEEIKKKMKDIDMILRKVKEVKTKEDAEISGWTDELEKVKARLSEIDENFFNKM